MQLYRFIQATIPAQMALSAPLWWPGSERLFPMHPAVDLLSVVPMEVSWVLSSVVIVSCLAYAFGWLRSSVHLPVVLASMALLCALDLNRLQIWVWMWYCLWVMDAFRGEPRSGAAFHGWILIAVYVWGGVNKLTPWFATNFDWFCEAFSLTKPFSGSMIGAYSAALGEMAIGLLLIWPPTRRWGIIGVFALHGYILLVLSPLGLNWNSVVWPWNVAMMALVWYFFKHKEPLSLRFSPVEWVIGTLIWVMPVLNIYQCWPESMSWKMYSNTQREASIHSSTGMPCAAISDIWQKKAVDNQYLLIDDWSYQELHVPAFNSMANFNRALAKIRECGHAQPGEVALKTLTVERWKRE